MRTRAVLKVTLVLLALAMLLSACSDRQDTSGAAKPAPETQTGRAELDLIVTAALGGDSHDLQQFLGYTRTGCTFAEGLGGPPRCLAGEQEGAPVEVLPFLGPEGHFIRRADIDCWDGLDASALFALYTVSESAYSDENYPAGEYALGFLGRPEVPKPVTLQVRQGCIVRIDYGFADPPEIRPEDVIRYLVPPGTAGP